MAQVDVLLQGHPLRSAQGAVAFCSVVLIRGEKKTLVDVGHVGRRSVLLSALSDHGLEPQDIDAVVLTHAHWDHVQNLDVFSHSQVLIHAWERRYAHAPHKNDWVTPAWTGAMIDAQPHIREVREGYEVEPGVHILHTPGHSPGCVSVSVKTREGLAIIAGDVIHFATVALTKENPLVFWSQEQSRMSIRRIVEQADVIYPGHDRPFRMAGDGTIEYLAPSVGLGLAGIDANDPSLTFDTSERLPWVMPGIEEQFIDGMDL